MIGSNRDGANEETVPDNQSFNVRVLKYGEVYDPRYTNNLTISAKEKLQKSSYQVCKEIAKVIATKDNNNEKLNLFIKKQDFLRKINIKDYLNF